MLKIVRKSGITDLRRPFLGVAPDRGKKLARKRQMEGWNRFDIIAAVRKKGGTLASIARSVGLSPKSIGWALLRPHPRANAAVAEFLGVPLHELWPQWFDRTGGRIGPHAPRGLQQPHTPTTRVRESNPRGPAPPKAA